MQNQIRADMLKVKRMVSEVEMIIGKREGETKLVNKLIDAENLLTYCMSRLENAFVPPCKIGDTVFLPNITDFETVEQYEVIEVGQDKDGQFFRIDDEESNKVYVDEIGKTVFLTPKEAAEKAIQKRCDADEPSNSIKL